MKIVNFSIKRSVTIGMLVLGMVVFGFVSYDRLPVNLLPNISYPSLTIKTDYEGAAPAEVEDVITKPIEEAVGVVNNIVRVSSVSRANESYVILEFAWKTNMDFASLNVREKLDLVQLPDEASKPVILKYDPSSDPILRIAASGNMNLAKTRFICDQKIKPYLENIDGVAAVKVNGGLQEEIYVELDNGRLDSLKIPITQVTQRLGQENINLTGGTLDEGHHRYLVRTLNQFKTVGEIGDVIIARRNNANITVNDIGRVYSGYKERDIITKLDGKEVIELAVYKAADANAVHVADAVRARIKTLLPTINIGGVKLRLEPVSDQSVFIRQSINDVLNTAVLGGILAVLILFLFLRNLKSTLIISLSIPISVVVTFFFMYLFDVTINIMSLGGLALGIGMLVDSSIVVLESIHRFREEGLGIVEAAQKGASDVGTAVVASTLTTICVFLPIVFVEGVAGQLFSDLALTVTFSLSASLIVSLTLIPMLASRHLPLSEMPEGEFVSKGKKNSFTRVVEFVFVYMPGKVLSMILSFFKALWNSILLIIKPFTWGFDIFYSILWKVYNSMIGYALGHRIMVFLIALVLMAGSVLLIPLLGSELIPEVHQGQFFVNLNRPEGTPLGKTEETVDFLSRRIRTIPGVKYVYTVTGVTTQSGTSVEEEKENTAQMTVQLRDDVGPRSEDNILDRVRSVVSFVPRLEYKFSRPTFFSFKTPIEVYIQGYNEKVLAKLASQVVQRMSKVKGMTDIKASTEHGNPEVQIVFNRRRLSSYGMTVQSVASYIRNQVLGDVATQFVRPEQKVDIRVRLLESKRKTLHDLESLMLQDASSNVIPLQSVANIVVTEGPAEIRRLNQQRVALITGNIEGRSLSSVVNDIKSILNSITFPPNYQAFLGGQSQEQTVAFRSMIFAVILALFLVYLVMASQFESLLQPFIIMFSIPFSVIGVVLLLALAGQSINVVVFIGIIILAGIVVNNAIVLIDCINHLRSEGLSKYEAIIKGCQLRFRPILMTTFTTILGLLPMAIGGGRGAELRTPLALTVIGGLTTSTMLTLVLIPVLYSAIVREKR